MAHNRSVLKERRVTPGAPTCFAVAECQGWRLGLVPRRRSAGSVLRSQGTWGQARLSRCRAMGIRVSTFLCSLRPDPAPLGVFGWALAGKLRGGWGFRAVREGFLVIASNARSGPIPLPPGAPSGIRYVNTDDKVDPQL